MNVSADFLACLSRAEDADDREGRGAPLLCGAMLAE